MYHTEKNSQTSRQLSNTYYLYIRLQLIIHQSIFSCPRLIMTLVFILGQLQTLAFLKTPQASAPAENTNKIDLIGVITYMTRPDFLITNQILFTINHSYGYLVYLIIVILFDVILMFALITYIIANTQQSSSMQEVVYKSNSIVRMLVIGSSYYSQYLHQYLHIPMMLLLIQSIRFNILQGDNTQLVFSLLTLILSYTFYLHRKVTCGESYSLIICGFEKITYNYLENCKEMLLIVMLIIYSSDQGLETSLLLQSCPIIILNIIQILQVVHSQVISNRCQCNIQLLIACISLIYTLCSLVNYEIISILLIPLLFSIIYQYWLQIQQKIKIQTLDLSIHQVKFYIAQLMNREIKQNTNKYVIQQAILYNQHQVQCNDVSCICRIPNFGLIQNQDSFMKILMGQLLKIYYTQLHSSGVKSGEQDYLHYISILNYLGETTKAYNLCNVVLNQQSDRQPQGIKFNRHQQNIGLAAQFSIQTVISSNQLSGQNISPLIQRTNKKQSRTTVEHQLINTLDLSYLTRQKLLILQQDIKNCLKLVYSQYGNHEQDEITNSVAQFLESEVSNSLLKLRVLKILQLKYAFYQSLQQPQDNLNSLYSQTKTLSQKIMNLENELNKLYTKFPSQKLQSITCFFQAELLNNYLEAHKVITITTLSDEKLISMRKTLKINLFNKNIIYLIVSLQSDLKTFNIKSTSNNAHQFFEYTQTEFSKQKTIDFLFPKSFRQTHKKLVKGFLHNGKSKYYRNKDLSFARLPNSLLKPIQMFYDFNLNRNDQITIAAFIEDSNGVYTYIMLDSNQHICGLSTHLADMINFGDFQNIGNLYKVNINLVIPNFTQLLKEQTYKPNNVSMHFLSKESLMTKSQIRSESKQNSKLDSIWAFDCTTHYNATIQIYPNTIYDEVYYFIEVENLKQVVQPQLLKINSIENQVVVNVKDQYIQLKHASDHLNISLEDLDIMPPYIFDPDNNPADANSYIPALQQSNLLQAFNIVSPNKSVSQLIQGGKQQRYFTNEKQGGSQCEFSKSQNSKELNEVNLDYQDGSDLMDKEIQNDIKQQLQLGKQGFVEEENELINESASQVSSFAGVRKSVFFKKYDLINQIISQKKMPAIFHIFYYFISAFIVTTCIYSIIVLANMKNDLNRFLQEIEMLQLHNNFMTPFDKFIVLRLQTLNYNAKVRSNTLTNELNAQLQPWLFEKLSDGYDDMKDNFQTAFQNPYLLEFFQGEYFVVDFMISVSSSELLPKNLTFQESLFTMLQYQYMFKMAYLLNGSTNEGPFVTYSYANYFKLHDKFEDLGTKILAYTQYRKNIVLDRWNLTWIPFLVLSVLFLILAYFAYRKYLRRYEQYLDIFRFVDSQQMDRDMQRFRILQSILAKDSDVMFKYTFNLEFKEQFLFSELAKKDAQVKYHKDNNKSWQKSNKLSVRNIILTLILIQIAFLGPSFYIQYQTDRYLEKYDQTSSVYKLTSDVGFRIPGVYAQRSMGFFITMLPYSKPDVKATLIKRLFDGLQDLKDFTQFIVNFEESKYLTTDLLRDLLTRLVEEPICGALTSEQLSGAEMYCSLSFEGSLIQGLSQTLTHIVNALQVEYEINNFTLNVERKLYEAEGVYILIKAMQLIITGMKQGLLSATQLHIDESNGIAIGYIAISIVLTMLFYTIVYSYYQLDYLIIRRSILLLPSQTLMLDDLFERSLRILSMKEDE